MMKRRERIEKLRSLINSQIKEKKEADIEEIICFCIVVLASSRRTAIEEIQAIIKYEGLKLEGEKIKEIAL